MLILKKLSNVLIGFILSSVLFGCGSMSGPEAYKQSYYKSEQAILFKQASFDLNCPVSKLKDQILSKYYLDIGITGCGKRVKYKYVRGVGWVANTISR